MSEKNEKIENRELEGLQEIQRAMEVQNKSLQETEGREEAGQETEGRKEVRQKTKGRKKAGQETKGRKEAGQETKGRKESRQETEGQKEAGQETEGRKEARQKTEKRNEARRNPEEADRIGPQKTRVFPRVKPWQIMTGIIAIGIFFFLVFFFTYYKVTSVEVLGNIHYTEAEVKDMVLHGAFSSNSILAPRLCSREVKDVPFVDAFHVTRLGRNAICINVREKKLVGCVSFLDSYVYFDRNGIFVESSTRREEKVPYFSELQIDTAVKYEKLPIRGSTILKTAIALSTIFQKTELIPEDIRFDQTYQISLLYGDIIVQLGAAENLEDKMARVLSILPRLEGDRGILHMENVTDRMKTVTFERDLEGITWETWTGGYDKNGEYTGDGEYDEKGRYVGARPKSEYDYALEAWAGGYDEDGDYTGEGPYDENMNYVGYKPTWDSIAENGDWKGGYDENGRYITYGEYDRQGNYVGSNPADESVDSSSDAEGEGDFDESEDSDDYSEDNDDYSEDYDEDSGYEEDYDEDYQDDSEDW